MYTTRRHTAKTLILLLACVVCQAQSPEASSTAGPMLARFAPGESLRYEFEGIVHVASAHAQNVTLNVPDDCSYHLRAVLRFEFDQSSDAGRISGRVKFLGARYEGPDCVSRRHGDPAEAVRKLETEEIKFDVNAAGEVSIHRAPAAGACEGVSLLLKAAWDALQTRLSDHAVSPAPTWTPSRRFLYWPDTFVENMEVAAASMQYRGEVTVSGKSYAWLHYKQVFSPTDIPAYVETRSEARDFTGTTFVSGTGSVSLLFDRSSGRVVYLQRKRTIDDRTQLKYESGEGEIPLGTISLDEESILRWLPERDSEAWLAELHKFESQVAEGGQAGSSRGEPESALAAASRRAKARVAAYEHKELSDLVDQTPRGFRRWDTDYCSNGYCFNLSIALPEKTKEAERRDGTVLLLESSGGRTVSIAVGPVLDLQYQGLDAEELLRQQTRRFVGNYLWFASGSGRQLNFENSSVRDRPAAFSDFTATARDLTAIRGRLVMVVAPYGRLAPVSCSYPESEQASSDAICQTVAGSVVIR